LEHFSAEEWADFSRGTNARGAAAGSRALEIERHLADGCAVCSASLRLWGAVHDAAGREAAYRAPDGSVRIARAMFLVERSRLGGRPARARLVFDSLRQPLLPGVRSHAAQPRQQLFSRGRVRVDTRLLPSIAPNQLLLEGQVIERPGEAPPPCPPGGSPTLLLYAADRPLAAANANQFGEFQLEFEPARDLRLWVVLRDQDPIQIRLSGPPVPPDAEWRRA
jgi:hypothetical protein